MPTPSRGDFLTKQFIRRLEYFPNDPDLLKYKDICNSSGNIKKEHYPLAKKMLAKWKLNNEKKYHNLIYNNKNEERLKHVEMAKKLKKLNFALKAFPNHKSLRGCEKFFNDQGFLIQSKEYELDSMLSQFEYSISSNGSIRHIIDLKHGGEFQLISWQNYEDARKDRIRKAEEFGNKYRELSRYYAERDIRKINSYPTIENPYSTSL